MLRVLGAGPGRIPGPGLGVELSNCFLMEFWYLHPESSMASSFSGKGHLAAK